MTLYMTELAVADLAISLRWYRNAIGMEIEILDESSGFALLRLADSGRLALKVGPTMPGSATIHFETHNLNSELERLGAAGLNRKVH